MTAGPRRWAQLAALASGLGLAACGGGKLTMKVTVPSGPTPADGQTPADISVLVTQGTTPVPDANGGMVEMVVTKGQFGPYSGTTADDPTQQSTTVTLALGTGAADLYSTHPGNTTVSLEYSDSNGSTASSTAVVTFSAVPDAGT